MAWEGWYEYGGVEIINAARTEQYAKAAGANWFRPVYKSDALGPLLGELYRSPLQDDAPWADPDNPDTYDFFGAYPLSVNGIEDSTATSSVIESTLDGGRISRSRRSTRAVVFSLALVGGSECAVESGMRWLKSAMAGGPCIGGGSNCSGANLCYLSCEPCIDWFNCGSGTGEGPTGCLDLYQRTLIGTAAVTGPTVTGKQRTTDGGAVWIVSLTVVAANPYEYGNVNPLVKGFMKRDNPYVLDAVGSDGETPFFDDEGRSIQDTDCPTTSFRPLSDPECPTLALPPSVPQTTQIPLSCFAFPKTFNRREFEIPDTFVPLWTEVVPVLTFHTGTKEVRNIRVRFYADVLGDHRVRNDPCAYCGDIVFSYIPPNSTLIFDGVEEQVYIDKPGNQRQRADSVVFDNDGGPFDWPQLTCGHPYLVTVDMPNTQNPPGLDLSLVPRTV